MIRFKKILNKKSTIISLISFFCTSCNIISDVPKNSQITLTSSSTEHITKLPIISIDNNGNGILVWNGYGKVIKNYLPFGEYFFISDEITESSIGLTRNGDGFIAWYDSSPVSIDNSSSSRAVFYIKMKAFKPLDKTKTISTKIGLGKFKIDENGNGLIFWGPVVNNIYYAEIKNFNISENIFSYTMLNNKSPYYIDNNKFNEIDLSKYSEITYRKLDSQGNGFYITKEQENSYLIKVEQYKLMDKKISLGILNFPSFNSCLDEQGNGFSSSVYKENIFIQSINRFNAIPNRQFITKNSIPKSEPVISVNEKGKGYLAWYEYSQSNTSLNVRLIDNCAVNYNNIFGIPL